jgi:hypothetical protein
MVAIGYCGAKLGVDDTDTGNSLGLFLSADDTRNGRSLPVLLANNTSFVAIIDIDGIVDGGVEDINDEGETVELVSQLLFSVVEVTVTLLLRLFLRNRDVEEDDSDGVLLFGDATFVGMASSVFFMRSLLSLPLSASLLLLLLLPLVALIVVVGASRGVR